MRRGVCFVAVVLFYATLTLGCVVNIADQLNNSSVVSISQIWNNLTITKPANQIHIAYFSSTSDYLSGAKTICDAYQNAIGSSNTNIAVQVMPFFIPTTFPFSYTESITVQLYNFQVDLIIGDNSLIVFGLAAAFQVPLIQLYPTYPNTNLVTAAIGDFISGFFSHNTEYPSNLFNQLYETLNEPQYTDSYSSVTNYNYLPVDTNYITDWGYYVYQPSNVPNFTQPLITYNPYIQQMNKITINFTVILDANLPYQFDMQFFSTLTTSEISRQATTALYIMTIPSDANQQYIDNLILGLLPYTGPRFVYAAYSTALQLMDSINRLGAFSTDFSQPVYQWHFLNLTAGTGSGTDFESMTCSPYIYHWELYNLTKFQQNCPAIATCSNCGVTYNRLLDCDFGYYLSDVVALYASQLGSTCLGQPGGCSSPTYKSSFINNMVQTPFDGTNYITGPMSFSSTGIRQGMFSQLYLGVNKVDAKLRANCLAYPNSSTTWNCSTVSYNSSTLRASSVQIQIATFNLPPYYYINATTNQPDGFFVAFASILAQQVGISNYRIYGVPTIGTYNSSNAKWTGVIGEVIGTADIAMAPLLTVSNLTTTLAFSYPYAQVGFSVLQQTADPTVTFGALFTQIFRPLTFVNWIMQVGIIVVVSILLTLTDYFSPNLVTFNLKRSWFYVFARSVMGAGGQNPDVFSSQILMLFWSFITMISISTYTANLAALSIDQQLTSTSVTKLADLLNGQWQPCCIANSFTTTYFIQSTVPLEVAVWQLMSQCQFNSQVEALAALANYSYPNSSTIALVMQQPSASYGANLYSNLAIVANYSLVNLVLAVPNGLQANVPVSTINKALQVLSTNGKLYSIINQYLRLPATPFPPDGWSQLSDFFDESAYTTQFTIKTQSGQFMIVGCGILLTLSFAGIEKIIGFIWKMYDARRQREMESLVNELSDTGTSTTASQNITSPPESVKRRHKSDEDKDLTSV